jgi:hypothetical protein
MNDDALHLDIDPLGIIDAAEADTLSGDIRDALLMHLRSIKVPWAMLAEDEQQQAIDAIQRTAEYAVRQACAVMAKAGAPHVHAKIAKWTVRGGTSSLNWR